MTENPALVRYSRMAFMAGAILALCSLVFLPFLAAWATTGCGLMLLPALLRPKAVAPHLRRWPVVAFPLLYLLGFVGYAVAQAPADLTRIMVLKLPMLLLPLGGAAVQGLLPPLRKWLWPAFVLALLASMGATVADYLQHPGSFRERILAHQPILTATGLSYIYFSVMLAAGTVLCGYLVYRIPRKGWKIFYGFAAACMLVYLHTWAARTGVVALYAALAFVLVRYLALRRKYKLLAPAAAAIVLAAVALWNMPGPFQEKINQTRNDLEIWNSGKNITGHSLSMRFAAWHAAWNLFLKNPVLGVSQSEEDLRREMAREFAVHYPDYAPEYYKLPHNQLLTYMAATGLPGTLLLLAALLSPWGLVWFRRNAAAVGIWAIVLLSLQGEAMLERQAGVVFILALAALAISKSPYNAGMSAFRPKNTAMSSPPGKPTEPRPARILRWLLLALLLWGLLLLIFG